MALRETEFIVQQHYKVTIDESAIDESIQSYSDPEADWAKKDIERNHRMLQSIMADEKALQSILEYRVIVAHALDLNSNSAEREFLEGHYGKEVGFSHILGRCVHAFIQEDREYIQKRVKEYEVYMESRDFDPMDFDTLQECFKVEPSGWNVQEHLCERKDS